MTSLLLLLIISIQRLRNDEFRRKRERRIAVYGTGHSLWSANQLPAQGVKNHGNQNERDVCFFVASRSNGSVKFRGEVSPLSQRNILLDDLRRSRGSAKIYRITKGNWNDLSSFPLMENDIPFLSEKRDHVSSLYALYI